MNSTEYSVETNTQISLLYRIICHYKQASCCLGPHIMCTKGQLDEIFCHDVTTTMFPLLERHGDSETVDLCSHSSHSGYHIGQFIKDTYPIMNQYILDETKTIFEYLLHILSIQNNGNLNFGSSEEAFNYISNDLMTNVPWLNSENFRDHEYGKAEYHHLYHTDFKKNINDNRLLIDKINLRGKFVGNPHTLKLTEVHNHMFNYFWLWRLTNLKVLYIRGVIIHVFNYKNLLLLKELESLSIINCKTIKIEIRHLKKLKSLYLSGKATVKLKNLPKLEYLKMEGCEYSYKGTSFCCRDDILRMLKTSLGSKVQVDLVNYL